MLVFGDSSTRGGDGLNRTFGRPSRRAEGTAGLSAGRADKYAEPIGTPNPGTVKSGGPVCKTLGGWCKNQKLHESKADDKRNHGGLNLCLLHAHCFCPLPSIIVAWMAPPTGY